MSLQLIKKDHEKKKKQKFDLKKLIIKAIQEGEIDGDNEDEIDAIRKRVQQVLLSTILTIKVQVELVSPPESSDDEEAKQKTLRLRHLAKARQEKKKKSKMQL